MNSNCSKNSGTKFKRCDGKKTLLSIRDKFKHISQRNFLILLRKLYERLNFETRENSIAYERRVSS